MPLLPLGGAGVSAHNETDELMWIFVFVVAVIEMTWL